MSNYIATTEELTAVADAIRAKGGTSEQLVFPEGFVAAIGDIQTGGGESSGIPSQYTRVEYLESHGTEYIDTGITLKNLAIAEFAVMVMDKAAFSGLGVAGVGTTDVPWASLAHYYADAGTAWYIPSNYFKRSNGNWSPGVSLSENKKQEFLVEMPFGKYGCFTVDGVKTLTSYTGPSSLDDTMPITIFALNGEGGYKLCASFRLYKFRMLDQGYNVIRDFIPCKVKATGEAGLYDLVSRQFFRNGGTGAFTAGNEVT